jgi:hypothetical protein
MKLTSLDLDYLRRGLRRHPRIAPEVADLDLDRMRTKQLVALTSRFGFDARALVDTMREQDQARVAYSRQYPAFKGTLDFDLTIEVLGKRVTRKARAEYTHTPDWEYWDLHMQAPHLGWPQAILGISIRTIPDKDGNPGCAPSWEKIDVLDIGELWEILDDAIEERCKAEDAKRRRAAERKRETPLAGDIARVARR